MISRVKVPTLEVSDGKRNCEGCEHFSTTVMAYPAGWCGRYHSFQPNTGIAMVCEKWKDKYKIDGLNPGDYDENGNLYRKHKAKYKR